jgi:hypothetical protein
MQIHLVFNINLLCPAAKDPVPGQQQPLLPPVEVEGIEQYKVEEVVDSF